MYGLSTLRTFLVILIVQRCYHLKNDLTNTALVELHSQTVVMAFCLSFIFTDYLLE